MHSCPYCEGYRVKQEWDRRTKEMKWVKTGSQGNGVRWVKRDLRSPNRNQHHHDSWVRAGAKEEELKDFCSVKTPGIKVFGDADGDTPFLLLFSPMPLHLLLGKNVWRK